MKIAINDKTNIDLQTLLDTRLLIQSNSGGGKSWLLRRLLEQSHGKVQQIILDLEGEFSTLRERYDYILAGKGGDTPAEPRSAALLARRLLELNVSAIIDLYELNHFERKRYVKLFLDSLVNAPKKLWHPALIIIDEAHVFAPQTGQSEASGSVIDLATRGRKRGYCAILATQRISKLHKDAAAECNNKLIGRTGLDVDMKRASEELGFTSKEQSLSLRSLAPDEFFAFGPAISTEVTKVKVGEVLTTHPKAGSRILTQAPLPPTEKIRGILGKLADLPKEAEEEAKSVEDYRRQNTELRRQLTLAQRQAPTPTEEQIKKAIQPHINTIELERTAWKIHTEQWKEYAGSLELLLLDTIRSITLKLDKLTPPSGEPSTRSGSRWKDPVSKAVIDSKIITPQKVQQAANAEISAYQSANDKPITGGALRMLQVLASRYPMTFTRSQLATLAKLSPRSGTYGTYLSSPRSRNLINVENDTISLNEKAFELPGIELKGRPQTTEEVISMWRDNLNGGARKMFEYLVGIYPSYTTRDILGEETGLSSTSGTFGTYLSMLRSNGLIDVVDGTIKASPNLFTYSENEASRVYA